MRKTPLITALLLSAASPALALEFGNGFYMTGNVELEYLESGGSSETVGIGEVDLGYEQQGGGFGAFVGLDFFSFDDQTETAVYGALTYSGSFGKVQIGVPRAALNDYIDTPDIGGSALFDLELSQIGGSLLPIIYLTSNSDTPVGLRYDGTFGAAKVGFSYHNINDVDIVDAAVNYQLGQVQLRAGLEHGNGDGVSDTNYFLGAEGEFGQVVAGFLYGDINLTGNGQSTQVYATYSPIEALDLTGTFISLSGSGSTQEFYGLSAKYTFAQGVYADAGYMDFGGSSSEIYTVGLGVDF